jgi:hypothetical protein
VGRGADGTGARGWNALDRGGAQWLEQLCLKSFVDQGQKITLFSYEDIPNVPAGVIRRDGREIIDTDDFIKYEKKDSFALFADLFRLHMIRPCPGMIWVDTDVYCHRPMDYDSDIVLGFELPGSHRVNNAVLGLPADSAILADMLAFTADRFSIAPFLKPALQAEYRAAAKAGSPVHVSAAALGRLGPDDGDAFRACARAGDQVQPLDAFTLSPSPTARNSCVAGGGRRDADPHTTALHSGHRTSANLACGLTGCRPRAAIWRIWWKNTASCPSAAPIKGRGKLVFDAGLVDGLGLAEVASLPISAAAQGLALAAQAAGIAISCWWTWTPRASFPPMKALGSPPTAPFWPTTACPPPRPRGANAAGLKPWDLVVNLAALAMCQGQAPGPDHGAMPCMPTAAW